MNGLSDLEQYRTTARAWLLSHVDEFGAKARRGLSEKDDLELGRRWLKLKSEHNYAAITMPKRYGGAGGTDLQKTIFDEEESAHAFPSNYFAISLGMPVPMMNLYGTEEEKARLLPRAIRGDDLWCQLFSEPGAGSDLAGIRTRAVRDGDDWVINGQKLWTSWAQFSDYAILVTRSDPTQPKHKGLTFFWLSMKSPGITVRPVRLAVGGHDVNEVFFDDVRIPDSQRMGDIGGGFKVAMETLFIERYTAASDTGFGPPLALFMKLACETVTDGKPAIEDGRVRREVASRFATQAALRALRNKSFLQRAKGLEPGPEGSIHKLVSARQRQAMGAVAMDIAGPSGAKWDHDANPYDDFAISWMHAPTIRIAGGADEMLLNTIAERILGLPQDHRPDKGVPFDRISA